MYIKSGSEKLSRLQHCLGIIEGVALAFSLALSVDARNKLIGAVDEIDSILDDSEPDNK